MRPHAWKTMRGALIGALILGGLIACGGDPRGLEWGVRFSSSADRDRARYVEGAIREGGCDGAELYRGAIPLDGSAGQMPPDLPPGVYGFEGRARDDSCNWFVAGCVEEALPASAPVIVTLEVNPGDPACPPEQCTAGRCDGDDAGTPDTGTPDGGDTSVPDTGMPMDSSTDTGPTDTGPADTSVIDTGGPDSCPAGWEYDPAAMRCRDVAVDPGNCGTVDRECEATQHCVSGTCVCRPSLERVDGMCTNRSNDPSYCGPTEADCSTMGSMVTCRSGTCEDACRTGQTNCSNACIDIDTDPRHCGGCDRGCQSGEYCISSRCQEYTAVSDCTECPCAGCGGDTCCVYDTIVTCHEGSGCPSE